MTEHYVHKPLSPLTWLTQTGVWVAATAVALLASAEAHLAGQPIPRLLVLAGLGTLAVYGFDRLIDDAIDKKERQSFVRRAGSVQMGLVVLSALAAGILALGLSPATWLLLSIVVLLSIAHTRLRRVAWLKPFYIASAWLMVVVGLPGLVHRAEFAAVLVELAPLGLAIGANVLACDASDREAEALQIGIGATWWVARAMAVAGIVVGWIGGGQHLVAVPACMFLAVLPMRPQEWYAMVVLDGALLLGGLVSLGLQSW